MDICVYLGLAGSPIVSHVVGYLLAAQVDILWVNAFFVAFLLMIIHPAVAVPSAECLFWSAMIAR